MPLTSDEIRKIFDESPKSTNFAQRIKNALLSPGALFRSLKGAGAKPAVGHLLVFAIFFAFLRSALATPLDVVTALIGCAAVFVMFIAGAMVFHIFAYAAGGRNKISATSNAVIYGCTPLLLFGWISVLLPAYEIILYAALGIWSLVLLAKGLSVLHNLNASRALVAAIVPVAIGIVFIFFLGPSVSTLINNTAPANPLAAKTIAVDGIANGILTVRTTGQSPVRSGEVAVYVSGAIATCAFTPDTAASGEAMSCALDSCPSGAAVRVSAPGNSENVICP